MLNSVVVEGWKLKFYVDVDGHLNLFISHSDGTEVHQLNADNATEDGEWADRFTTQGIEEKYKEKV